LESNGKDGTTCTNTWSTEVHYCYSW
jgi:hypothetical protein